MTDGVYGDVALTDADVARLSEIFPEAVCDHSQPDLGRPDWLSRGH